MKKSLYHCEFCGHDYYFNRCWSCGAQIVGTPKSRCPACGWYHCPACRACKEDCDKITRYQPEPSYAP